MALAGGAGAGGVMGAIMGMCCGGGSSADQGLVCQRMLPWFGSNLSSWYHCWYDFIVDNTLAARTVATLFC